MNDTVCKNWFMRKSGKTWVYVCALVSFVGLALARSCLCGPSGTGDCEPNTSRSGNSN